MPFIVNSIYVFYNIYFCLAIKILLLPVHSVFIIFVFTILANLHIYLLVLSEGIIIFFSGL